MKETRNQLMAVFIFALLFAIGAVVLYETGFMESGLFVEQKNSEFLLTALMELLTLGGVFLALRLFKFPKVHQDLVTKKEHALFKWGILRLALLLIPMVANTYLYYMFMNTTFGYMAIIQLLCLPFVFPTMSRCQSEVESEE
ncbi:hypothetical protein [Xylanibacter ruminicola]|jgi:hypothetical protein|uniref:Uncharacterized protein n=1 Tax=Xylanibacter ruminicola TaxID=839 RepID=A0A1M6V048_XYLRU|nr:hypothetical protein [Xylanibacter ruminicola]SHK74887.1 hypothetical protein SAMN05216463_11151 [Xylanibacter ruminicola]